MSPKLLRIPEKLKKKVFPAPYKENLNKFESSNDNMLRSNAVYNSKGVMGKVKYRSVYKSSFISASTT